MAAIWAMVMVAATSFSVGTAAAGLRGAPTPPAPTQALVVLLAPHTAMSAPSARGRVLEQVSEHRPITGAETVLPVLGHSTAEGRWLKVRLPGRPNGHVGWIRERATRRTQTEWLITVTLTSRRVTVYRLGRPVKTFGAVIGKPATPTPRGTFFIEEAVQLPARDAGAPFALALSGRSDVLQTFQGGPGQIALHGRAHLNGSSGEAVSHGCVRLDTDAITWIVAHVGVGAPVTID